MLVNIFEHIAEKDGRKRVKYVFTDINNKVIEKDILEDPGTDVMAKAVLLQADIMQNFKEEEEFRAVNLILNEGVDISTLTFTYSTKREVLQKIYDNNIVPEEVRTTSKLTKIQNLKNTLYLFLTGA